MWRFQYIAIITLSTFMIGCSGYNEVLKSDDYKSKFNMANELYKEGVTPKINKKGKIKKQYREKPLQRSIALNEQIYQRSPKSGEGELAYYRIGTAYYFTGDYYMGGYFWECFRKDSL